MAVWPAGMLPGHVAAHFAAGRSPQVAEFQNMAPLPLPLPLQALLIASYADDMGKGGTY